MSPLDPRVRMRDALRELVAESPTRWDKPSLFVLRNRLLDRTGSDARPLAEFLIEALRRGWRDRLPSGAVDTSRFDGMVAPFVLQWSTERFVQPEMARWAVESWAYALRVIDESQIRIAPPPKRESMSAMAARLNAGAAAAGAQAAQAARAVAQAMGSGAVVPAANTGNAARSGNTVAAAAQRPPAGRNRPSGTTNPGARFNPPYGAATGASTAYAQRQRSAGRSVPGWLPRALFGTLCAMGLVVVGRVAIGNLSGKATGAGELAEASATYTPPVAPSLSGAPANSPSAAMAAPMPSPLVSANNLPGVPVGVSAGGAAGVPVAPGLGASQVSAGAPTIALRELPANAAPVSARTVSPSLTGGVPIMATERPGVPSITRGLLSTGADSTRMVFVQPARRAAGEGRRMQTPSANTPITFDELHFTDGGVMQGRVDVVRAGTVIFRDMRTGLRHEYRKDDIAEIITEFGTIVRFRGEAPPVPAATSSKTAKNPAAARAAASGNGVRTKGVAGRYRIRYAAASAVGSPECTQVWTRAPNSEDIAVVTHIPGADTLAVAFEGGDVFPSNVDPDGYFASTFRIVPDQARTMTALTTRLNGRFAADGALQVTVNIVFYRRLRTGEITCNVTVKADGKRER